MGYGEVGGDGSVQVSVHLRHPREDPNNPARNEVDEGPPARVHADADSRNQRSERARNNAGATTPGRAYRGQDGQGTPNNELVTEDAANVFTVTIWFSRQGDLTAARNALANIDPLPAGGAEATFPLKVIRRAGQVHVSWPDGPGGQAV
jgi:hypothetical protein